MYTFTLWACEKVAYKNDYDKIDVGLYRFMMIIDALLIIALVVIL